MDHAHTDNHSSDRFDVIILGAGAAGLYCALTAASRKIRVLVLEQLAKPCIRVRASGGGKCNFSNTSVTPDNYYSDNPHFCKSALARFQTNHFLSLLKKHGIKWTERENGRLFLSGTATGIAEMLIRNNRELGTIIRCGVCVQGVEKSGNIFKISTTAGEFTTPALITATGGLARKELGASGVANKIAANFGISVILVKPALVPFTLSKRVYNGSLSGISIDAEISCGRKKFRDALLFTHRGISGPAGLQASLYWKDNMPVTINMLPDNKAEKLLAAEKHKGSRISPKTILGRVLPKRLVSFFAENDDWNCRTGSLAPVQIDRIAGIIHRWTIVPEGTEGFEKAEVSRGGVSTAGISSRTMECLTVPGLYFIGEALDVTGMLGGYNLHWAWASGHAAGSAVPRG